MSQNKYQIYPVITRAENHPLSKAVRLALGNNSMAVAEHYNDRALENQATILQHSTEYQVFLSSVAPCILNADSEESISISLSKALMLKLGLGKDFYYNVMSFICVSEYLKPADIYLVYKHPLLYWIDIGHTMLFFGVCNNAAE